MISWVHLHDIGSSNLVLARLSTIRKIIFYRFRRGCIISTILHNFMPISMLISNTILYLQGFNNINIDNRLYSHVNINTAEKSSCVDSCQNGLHRPPIKRLHIYYSFIFFKTTSIQTVSCRGENKQAQWTT